MNVCGVTFGGYLTKILSFKTGNLLNNSKFHLLSEGTVQMLLLTHYGKCNKKLLQKTFEIALVGRPVF